MAQSGRLKYSDRAFAQDADLAMGSDPIRALLELITNSDDAYGSSRGDIIVTVDQSNAIPTISVLDFAVGLTPAELLEKFGELGAEHSGFRHGANVRGFFGRGAKDTAAFGKTVFEAIKDGQYGRFEILRSSEWTLEEEQVTDEAHQLLGIPVGQVGLLATIYVDRPGISIPNHRILTERLASHVQLRELTQRHTVRLRRIDRNNQSSTAIVLWEQPSEELIVDTEISIPEFDATANITLWQLKTASDTGLSAHSPHGVTIKGRRAAYENSLFGITDGQALRIRGELRCEFIDELIRSYAADNITSANPEPLLRRDRTGLNKDHPFYEALEKAALNILLPIVDSLRPEQAAATGSSVLREELNRAAAAINSMLESDLKQLDEEDFDGTTPDSNSPLIVIPPVLKVQVGSEASLSVLIDNAILGTDIELNILSSDDTIVSIRHIFESSPYIPKENATIRTVRFASHKLGSATITISDMSTNARAKSSITVHDGTDKVANAPQTLEWASTNFAATRGSSRTLRLRAPLAFAPEGTLVCQVAVIESSEIMTIDNEVTLRLTKYGWLEGKCQIRSLQTGLAKIQAKSSFGEATTSVRISEPKGLAGTATQLKILNEARGRLRGQVELGHDGYSIQVFKRHVGLDQVLGADLSDGSFRNERQPEAKIALAEAVSSIIADWLLNREYERFPQQFPDAAAAIDARNKHIQRYLPAIRRALELQADSPT